jgi:isohexenylglutaconyl-CoA hydratase
MTPMIPDDLPQSLQVVRQDACVHVTFNRAPSRNAFDREMWLGLERLIASLEADTAARIVVLRGAGGNFCAGGDLRERVDLRANSHGGADDPLAMRSEAEADVLRALQGLPQVVVAAVEGIAAGAGVSFVAVSDIVIAEAGSVFMTPEVRLGFPPAQVLRFLVRRIGEGHARTMLLTGGKIRCNEAQRIGLVDMRASGKEAFEAALAALVSELHLCAPGAIAATKALFDLTALPDYPARAARAFAARVRSSEGAEGERAFLDRRKPAWCTTAAAQKC